jgi:hypothetical protein
MTFESEDMFDSDSFNFGLRGITQFGEIGLLNPRLNAEAEALKKNAPAFYARCGREWVSEETRGVEIALIYSIKNVSQSQRSRLEASLSAGLNGGALFGGDISSKLTQIASTAFMSNYYTVRVFAIGGHGVSDFADTISHLDEPTQVLNKISEYMKSLQYEESVPLSFQTGSLDQFLASEDQGALIFDPINRRLTDLFLAYSEYRARRLTLWRYLNDDTQALWETTVDPNVWDALLALDGKIAMIEARAKICTDATSRASDLDSRLRKVSPRPKNPAPTLDFLRAFSHGISSQLVQAKLKSVPPECKPPTSTDDLELANNSLCECLYQNDDDLYYKKRFPISSVPHVDIEHDTTSFSPNSLIYVRVKGAAAITSAIIKDQTGTEIKSLTRGYDPDEGAVWFGALVYHGSDNSSIEKQPLIIEMKDRFGRIFTKPIKPQ